MKNVFPELLCVLLACTAAADTDSPLRHPVLALHGYNGDDSTWSDAKALLKQVPFPDCSGNSRTMTDSDFLVMRYYADADGGHADLGCSTSTPIEDLAELVRYHAEHWLEDYHPGSTFNVMCHSMGGLVFRQMLADIQQSARTSAIAAGRTNLAFTADTAAASLFHRCADLGTPHYGQNLAIDRQSRQMRYASPYLRSLADAWHCDGASFTNMNYIIGIGYELDFPADGLVDAVSASMLTRNQPDFSRRVAYVDRIHSTMLGIVSDLPAIYEMDSAGDTVFKLILATFSEGESAYGDGSGCWKPTYAAAPWKFLRDDGYLPTDAMCEPYYNLFASTGLAFIQVLKEDGTPIVYDTGIFLNDKVVQRAQAVYGTIDSDEIEQDSEAIANGCALVWVRNIPASGSKFLAEIGKPRNPPSGYSEADFNYDDIRNICGGGGNLYRTYPKARGPRVRSFSRTTCAGTLTTSTTNLFAAGLIPSPLDETGGAALLDTVAPNGLSWPLCLKLGVVDSGTVPPLRITAADFTAEGVELSAAVGDVPFEEIGFPTVRLLAGDEPAHLDDSLAPSAANPRFFPDASRAADAVRCYRLQVSEQSADQRR